MGVCANDVTLHTWEPEGQAYRGVDGPIDGWMEATERKAFWEMELLGGTGLYKVIDDGGKVSVGQHLAIGVMVGLGV